MKRRIGIVPKAELFDMEKSNMNDRYILGNNYTKQAAKAGCIPIGVAPVDNWLPEDELEVFDGYLVQGGPEFYPYHFQIARDAIEHHKPYLGICLGAQLIYTYLALKKMVEEAGYEGDLVKANCTLRERRGPDFSVLKPIPGHRAHAMTRGKEDAAKHDVSIVPGTMLHRLLGRDTMRIASFHDLIVPPDQSLVTVNAWAAGETGIVEGVECSDHVLGIQGHPEVDDLLPQIFSFLTEA